MLNFFNCRLILLAALLWLAVAGICVAQREGERLRESVFLDTDQAAVKKLTALQEYLRAEQWSEAIQLATQILEDHPDKLVPVSPGRYVSLPARCQAMLATMPVEGLQLLRQKVDPRAEQWFQEGVENRDAAPLRRILRHAFLSSYGDDAAAQLAEMAFERGALGEARSCWELVLPLPAEVRAGEPFPVLTYPDTDLDRAEVKAKLALCSLLQNNSDRFERELAALSQQHARATGHLAGREGRFAAILQTLANEFRNGHSLKRPADQQTFAGNPARNLNQRDVIDDIGAVQWIIPVKPAELPRMPRRLRFAQQTALSHFPLAVGELLFSNDETTISAYNLTTGKPAWSEGDSGDAVIYRSLPAFGRGVKNRMKQAGIPRYTLTADQGRLYARMGSPVTGRSPDNPLARSESHLVCLDIATGQGKLLWTVNAGDLPLSNGNWEFEGTPAVADGSLYVALRNSTPQPQAFVACLDAENGRLLWKRRVCTFLPAQEVNVEEVSHQLLTLADGRLFYSTNQGAIAALDARDGSLAWVVTYEPNKQNHWTSRLKSGLVPCVYHEGTLIAAPSDLKLVASQDVRGELHWRSPAEGTVIALDAKTGVRKWSRRLQGGIRHILGVEGQQVIVSGDILWSLDLDSGQIKWRSGQNDVVAHGYGRGLIGKGLVFWPKKEAIEVFEIATGRPHAELKLQPWRAESGPVLTGGNLLMAGGLLIVSQADALVAYSQWGRVRKQLQEQLSVAPGDAQLHLRLALLEEAAQQWESALDEFQAAVKCAEPKQLYQGRPLSEFAAAKQAELLLMLAESSLKEDHVSQARTYLRRASKLPVAPALRQRILSRLAAASLAAERGQDAVAALQDIIADAELSRLWIEDDNGSGKTARRLAVAKLNELILQFGQSIYQSVEEQAAEEIASHAAADDPASLVELLQKFPHAQASQAAWLSVAEEYETAGDDASAINAYLCIIDSRDPEIRKTALLRLARIYERGGDWRLSQQRLTELADEFPDAVIESSSESKSVAEYVSEQLQRDEYRRQAALSQSGSAVLPLRRQWQLLLSGRSKLLIPHGMASAIEKQAVVTLDEQLRCVNSLNGRIRWQEPAADDYQWAAYAGTNLLLWGPQALESRDVQTGKRVWRLENFHRSPNAGPGISSPRLIDSGSEMSLFIRDPNELTCIDLHGGTIRWRFRPAHGTLQRQWLLTTKQVVLQVLDPDWIVILDCSDGTVESRRLGPDTEWAALLKAGDGDFLSLTTGPDSLLVRRGPDAAFLWRYRRAISQTNAPPVIRRNRHIVLLIEDGDTLVGIDAATGAGIWSASLGRSLIRDAASQIVLDDRAVYAANDGILRAYSASNGKLLWETYLGDEETPRVVEKQGPYLAVYPRHHLGPESFHVLYCDPETGEFVQKLRLAGHGLIRIHGMAGVALINADDRLHALAGM